MSTQGIRNFRPELHFTPPYGWTNDPNGLVYADGVYHLFYQCYPFDTVWGPMYWGHATSTDLLHWTHQPIALAPDELGLIFSGSAVYDRENTSGFGSKEQPPIVAMFTHSYHDPSDPTRAHDHQQQSIAYSTDGVHFTKYEGNPVLCSDLRDFRDPKIFHNTIKGCWGMVLAAGDHVEFYASKDLKQWEKTGTFGPEGNYSEGVWECPDLFPMEIEGETKWLLIVSMGRNHANHGSRTQYFLGSFDGDTFTPDKTFDKVEMIDDGFDNYAGVTFDNADRRILIGWGVNWVYADKLPTGPYCGNMTLPRVLSLARTPLGGVRLASAPIDPFGETSPSDGSLPSELFKLVITGNGPSTVTLGNGKESFSFGIDAENRVFVDRSKAGADQFSEVFADEWYKKIAEPRFYEGEWKMEFYFDRSMTELFVDGGTRSFSQLLFPDTPYTTVSATGEAHISIATL